jgi:hypothetical protein
MSIESRNKIFSGQHTLLFKKDEPNKLLKMELRSDSLFLVARKGLFYYEGNLKTINKLVKMSDQ